VKWHYNVNGKQPRRNGWEYFPEDQNYLYEIAQFYPRMAVYSDHQGWQHKQFLGSGEFALPFGDYRVSITAPADHVVGATGVLQNPAQVLTTTQQKRLLQAKSAQKPVLIVSQDEAVKNEGSRAKGTKTWTYAAKNVRDFAWVSSRKFIWDAMQITQDGTIPRRATPCGASTRRKSWRTLFRRTPSSRFLTRTRWRFRCMGPSAAWSTPC
jgi:hypothetical protein